MNSRASENVGPGAVLTGAELTVVVPTFNGRDNSAPCSIVSKLLLRVLVGR